MSTLKPNAITRMTAWRHQGESGFSDGSLGMDDSLFPMRDGNGNMKREFILARHRERPV